MILVIAEKPSVAQSIAKVLGATSRKDGYMEGGNYIVSWCFGHLVELADASSYDERYAKWRYDDLPIVPESWMFEVTKDKAQQFKVLSALMKDKRVTELVCATDAGREGELIFRLVYNKAGCTKPFKRLWISSLEDSAIREGFNHLRDGKDYDRLYEAALSRSKADWIVGINGTRLFTTLYHKKLVVGRVQTPTLAMLVERDGKISTFQKEKYFNVHVGKGDLTADLEKVKTEEEAKKIALKDAKLDELVQKIVFTREELSRNSGKPCYILEFYTAKKQYSYKVDAKDGSILEAYHFILLADAKKIALDDAGVSEKVTFTEETLVAGGIKSPYYYFVFESDSARWTYKIDAVLGVIMDKTCDKIIPPAPEFIGLEKAKQIALEDAGLDEATQKIVFTREGLSRNQGKPCYILEFYTDKCAYSYKVDAVSGEIIGKKTEWFSRQESETVPDTSQNSDSKQRRGN